MRCGAALERAFPQLAGEEGNLRAQGRRPDVVTGRWCDPVVSKLQSCRALSDPQTFTRRRLTVTALNGSGFSFTRGQLRVLKDRCFCLKFSSLLTLTANEWMNTV